ncbi:hypothetical protein AC1031_008772 [Aphanomyces cochlioides]|nr:hypothetical protein AC1031_008772 [Aphanomyces cochlioides]
MRPLSWLLSFTLLSLSASAADAQLSGLGPPVLPDVLSTLLAAYKPLLSKYAEANLPATVGNCKEGNPPPNCTEIGNLFEEKKTFYHVKARWISGINTMRLEDLNMVFDPVTGAMTLNIKVHFDQLPASLLVEACAGALGCSKFLDNTQTCCGTSKTVAMTATAKCSEKYPFLQSLIITNATIVPGIGLTLDIFGSPFQVADVTPSVVKGLKDALGTFLSTQGLDLFNTQIKSLFGDKVYCSRASRDAQQPSTTPVTLPPTMTPRTTIEPTTAAPPATTVDGTTKDAVVDGQTTTPPPSPTAPASETQTPTQTKAPTTTLRPSAAQISSALLPLAIAIVVCLV